MNRVQKIKWYTIFFGERKMDLTFIVCFFLGVVSPGISSSLPRDGTSLKTTNPKSDTIGSPQLCRISGYACAFPGLRVTDSKGKKTFILLEGLEQWPLTISNKRITVSGILTIDTTDIDYRKGIGLIKNPRISPKGLMLTSPALFNADKRFSRQRIETDLQLNSAVKEPRSEDSIIIVSSLKNSSKKTYLILRPSVQDSYDIRLKECEEWNTLKMKNEEENARGFSGPKDIILIDTVFLAPGKQIKWQENLMRFSFHNLMEPDTCQIRVHYAYSGNFSNSKKTTGVQAYLDSAVGIPNFDIVSKPIDIYFTKSNINALNDTYNENIDKRSNRSEATIFIATIPPGADVYLGRTLIGKSNTGSLKLPAGIHCLRFVKNGNEIVKQFDFKPGKNQSQSVRFH
jgi:hypothetical protein